MKRNSLYVAMSKEIEYDGRDCRMSVTVKLADECHNKHCDFSITADVYLISYDDNEGPFVCGGCCHDLIARHFPELKKFIPLHLCGHEGTPLYAVENGIYHIVHSTPKVAKEYLRITDDEFMTLSKYIEDKTAFAYMLFSLGIVDRWKKEADELIAYLEAKCGYEWENPYSPEVERFRLFLKPEDKKLVEKRLSENYYSDANIKARRDKAIADARQKMYDEVNKEYEEATKTARIKRDVKICILNAGLKIDNVIYYNHSNELVFNWNNFSDKVSREEFDRFCAKADYSLLPDDITIKFGE